MKKFTFVLAAALLLVLAGCGDIFNGDEGGASSVAKDDFSRWADSWSYSEEVRGQGQGHVAMSITASGIYGLSTTTLYYCLEQKETASFEGLYESQLKALTSQYELGLILRQEYESEAQRYAAEYDEKCAPIAAKYKDRRFSGNIEKDNDGYFIRMKEKKARLQLLSTSVILDDPITGKTYIMRR